MILSPTTAPPPSRGISMEMSKSLRLMTVVASNPATGPWPMPGFDAVELEVQLDLAGDAVEREVAGEDEVAVPWSALRWT